MRLRVALVVIDLSPMGGARRWPILIGAWLLIGQQWPGVDAWENLEPMRRKPFRSQAECETVLSRRRQAASEKTKSLWNGARCVTREDFHRYRQSRQTDD